MEKRTLLFSLFSTWALVTAVHATSQPQLYLGAQAGLANTNFSNSSVMTTSDYGSLPVSASIQNHVFAGRGYAGYQFNDYFALEGGYLRPRNTRYSQINGDTVPTGDVSEYGLDLTAKVFLPMAAFLKLSPYLKAGATYMDANSQGSITRNGASDFGYSTHPLVGAGIGYAVTPYLIADVSWTTIPQSNTNLPRIDLFFIGLTYHFSFENTMNGGPNFGDSDGKDL